MKKAIEILHQYWGFSSFKFPQEEIINSVLEKKDTIALLPTGGGKSVCFQIPALYQEGTCLVISPLIALMQDQVAQLKNKGIKATLIPSSFSTDEIITLFDNIKFGNFKFLYLSPERLQSHLIQQKITELNVNVIAIDEAHCISEWGHDFRPSYRNISLLRTLIPNANMIALTASATQKVIDDITRNLALENPIIIKKSFFRKHLAYQIYTVEDKLLRLKQIFKKTKKPGIVYVTSRKKTKEISDFLNANQFKSSYYHGKLSAEEKELAFENWMTEKTPIMVATNAFGMGIDKQNVGVVIHLSLPNSIENYLQEAGRAGRNDEKSFSVVLQNSEDIRLYKKQLKDTLPTIEEIKSVYKKLFQHFQIANGELFETPFDFNFLAFCEKYNFIPNKVAPILQILNNYEVLKISTHFNKKSTLFFTTSNYQVVNYANFNKNFKQFMNTLLRNYGGIFEQETQIDEYFLAKKAAITSHQVIAYLKQLEVDGIVSYQTTTNNSEIIFLHPREEDKTINRVAATIKKYITQKQRKGFELIHFIQNSDVCRSQQILNYFDERNTEKCGICDVCLAKKKGLKIEYSSKIIAILKNNIPLSSKEITDTLNGNDQEILIHLRYLLLNDHVVINAQNKFYLKK
jgi:ATP-dependent DNA helicase RecQ